VIFLGRLGGERREHVLGGRLGLLDGLSRTLGDACRAHLAGMRRGVDLLQLPDRHLGVDLGGRELGVPEHRLDVADVGAVLQHQRRHRVAEQVAGAAFPQVRGVHVVAHHLRQPVRREKRGPAPKLQQQIERIQQLPRPQQKFVMRMLDTVLQQAGR
jgi:hypothetical protein